MKQYAIGTDIGGTTVKLGLFETTGTLIDTWEIPTRTENNGEYILKDIAESINEKLKKKMIKKSYVTGMGVGVPGPVLADGTVHKCVNLGWNVINVERELETLTGFRVKAGNDANVAALGEMWQGGGKGSRNMVMVTLGTGVGGGIIVGGHIVSGNDGAAGEIGHIPVRDDEIQCCGCGKKGCLEQYASATGMVRMLKQYLKEHAEEKTILNGKKDITAKDIFDAAKQEDDVAVKIIGNMGVFLGKALASIACVTNPEVFVIGGGVSRAGNILIEAIRNQYQKYAFHAAKHTKFCVAELGNLAGIYGSVKLILED